MAVDVLVGAVAGIAILHPLSMLIVGLDAVRGHEGHGSQLAAIVPLDPWHLSLSPMAWYFAALGAIAGAISGWFRMQLQVKNRALASTLAEKASLLRVLTHDLANTIIASGALIEVGLKQAGSGLRGQVKEDLVSASSALEQGRELIGFAHTLLEIESGKVQLHPVPRDVVPLVAESLELFRHRCGAKRLAIELTHPPDTEGKCPALVEPDIFKNSILNNLLSNAVKFSEPGRWIRVEIAEVGRWVQVSVTNIGRTIPPERLPSLFSPTDRTTTPGTAGERGSGFGLPLALRYCLAMHGQLDFRAEPSSVAGASLNTFRVRVPAVP